MHEFIRDSHAPIPAEANVGLGPDIVAQVIGTTDRNVSLRAKRRTLFKQMTRLDPAETEPVRRLVDTDWVSLYYLLTTDALDDFYIRYLTRSSPEQRKFAEAHATETKTELAIAYLRRTQKRNLELTMASRHQSPITIGVEVEYFPTDKYEADLTELGKLTMTFARKHERMSVCEIATNPSASPQTQLRLLLQLAKIGTLDSSWGVHETIGGITLTPEHTQAMDLTALLWASRYLPWKNPPGQTIPIEKIGKKSEYGCYFPFHRQIKYLHETPWIKKQPVVSVEFRSWPMFKKGEFPRLVRATTFTYLAGWGIRAVQLTPRRARTDLDSHCAQAWARLMDKWNSLLQRYGLENPLPKERYVDIAAIFAHEEKGTTGYEHFLRDLRLTAYHHPQFQKETRRLIRDYSWEVKQWLGL